MYVSTCTWYWYRYQSGIGADTGSDCFDILNNAHGWDMVPYCTVYLSSRELLIQNKTKLSKYGTGTGTGTVPVWCNNLLIPPEIHIIMEIQVLQQPALRSVSWLSLQLWYYGTPTMRI